MSLTNSNNTIAYPTFSTGQQMSYTSLPQAEIMQPFSDETPSSRMAPRVLKAPPGGGFSGGTTNQPPVNPPVGDAMIPLLLMAIGYAIYIRVKRKRKINN